MAFILLNIAKYYSIKILIYLVLNNSYLYIANILPNPISLSIIELNSKGNTYNITAPLIIEINKYLLSNKFRQQRKNKSAFYLIWKSY